MPPKAPPPPLQVVLTKVTSSAPADVRLLESRLRTANARARKAESALASLAMMGAVEHTVETTTTPVPQRSFNRGTMNALTADAERLVQAQQQAQSYEDSERLAQTLAQQLDMVDNQDKLLRQSLGNMSLRMNRLREKNNQRLLAAQSQEAKLLIQREHSASMQILQSETSGVRQNLRNVLLRQSELLAQYQQASKNTAALGDAQRQATEAAATLLRSQQSQQRLDLQSQIKKKRRRKLSKT